MSHPLASLQAVGRPVSLIRLTLRCERAIVLYCMEYLIRYVTPPTTHMPSIEKYPGGAAPWIPRISMGSVASQLPGTSHGEGRGGRGGGGTGDGASRAPVPRRRRQRHHCHHHRGHHLRHSHEAICGGIPISMFGSLAGDIREVWMAAPPGYSYICVYIYRGYVC